ncbi:porin [Jhaorihella thermophila]|uniref:Porin n=1 Tax=Jhaorihella thermophila TaxID=488547 RepID=A0A1H5Y2E7_9RHOB|nr:porin [Jhaorihella thermophila]SEG18229.1 porin [Jhaorihella thermophila]
MKQKRLLPVVAATVATGLAVPAAAEMKYENGSGGSVVLYGQFNPAYQSVDDGVKSYSNLVDNTNSKSRVGLWLRQEMANGTLSFNFETALGLRASAGMTQGSKPDWINWNRKSLRKADFAWATDQYGKFSFGQGSMASDGIADIDLSGTSLAQYNGIGDTAGGYKFRTTAGAISTKTLGSAFPSFDGGRLGRVRYDTPSFSGFSVAVSYGEDILTVGSDKSVTDIAVRYSGEAGSFKLRGALAYAETDPGAAAKFHDTIGSFSALHDSGFNVTVALGDRSNSGNYAYGKLGYQADWFAAGKTALAVDYYDGDDMTVAGSQSKSWGIGAVQKFDRQNVEAYVAWRNYELSEPGTSYKDASSILAGARWKF